VSSFNIAAIPSTSSFHHNFSSSTAIDPLRVVFVVVAVAADGDRAGETQR
jgi:hypothetical protein